MVETTFFISMKSKSPQFVSVTDYQALSLTLAVHHVKNNTVYGGLICDRKKQKFTIVFRFLLRLLLIVEKHQALEKVFYHISKHLECHLKILRYSS